MPALTASRPLRAALRYASLDWKVLPLHTPDAAGACSCRRRDCPKPGKHPRTERGLHEATNNPDEISEWWARWPDANIGVATGELIVIDVDGAAGEASLQELQHDHRPLPATLEAASGHGRHLYFTAALRAELADVATARAPTATESGTRNDTLNRAAFRLAQLAAPVAC